MSPDEARIIALRLTIHGVGRYLDCLHGVVSFYHKELPFEFVNEVDKDFLEYYLRMSKAGFKVKILDNSFFEKDIYEL